MVAAFLVEHLVPTPETCEYCLQATGWNLCWRDEYVEKEAGNGLCKNIDYADSPHLKTTASDLNHSKGKLKYC